MTLDVYDNDLGNATTSPSSARRLQQVGPDERDGLVYRSIRCRVWMLDLGRSFGSARGGRHPSNSGRLEDQPQSFSVVTDGYCRMTDGTVEGASAKTSACSRSRRWQDAPWAGRSRRCSSKAPWGDGAQALQRNTGAIDDHRPADAFKTGSMPELGPERRSARQDLAVMLNPYHPRRRVRPLLPRPQQHRLLERLHGHRGRSSSASRNCNAVVNILLMYQITGQMYLSRDRRRCCSSTS